jgi:tetratricopeptide (TPR) repeat protein
MNLDSVDWNDTIELDPEQEYRALRNGLRRARGFGLFFVQCSPSQGTQLINRLRQDLPKKQIDLLEFDQAIDDGNVYQRVEDFLQIHADTEILFIRGLEYSLLSYEETQRREGGLSNEEVYSYSWKAVPRLLGNLNLRREKFRDSFPICFVFLVPLFALKYLIRRAPDFFDWRSGVFELPTEPEVLERESLRVMGGDYKKYLDWTQSERDCRVADIQACIDETYQTSGGKAALFFEQGLVFAASKMYQAAIASFDKGLNLKHNNYSAWGNRGNALHRLGRYEDAIASFDKVLDLKPDSHLAWCHRGNALCNLGRYEDAITSYDKSLELKPDFYTAWYSRGDALYALERYEDAITSYDRSLELKPDFHTAWYSRGNALYALKRYEDAITSYEKSLELNPNSPAAWGIRGDVFRNIGRYTDAISSYDKVLEFKPNNHLAWSRRGDAFGSLERYDDAISSFNEALKHKPDDHKVWFNRGVAFGSLERYDDAISSFNEALKHKPDLHAAWYNKACCYALQSQVELTIADLKEAIELNPKYREMAKTDSDFDSIRNDDRFQSLINAE